METLDETTRSVELNDRLPLPTLKFCLKKIESSFKDEATFVHHYTGLNALDAILREGFLRATDARFLNDSSEVTHGEDILSSALSIKDKNTCLLRPLSVSFCETGDSLEHWAIYAKELGISLGMDFDIDKTINSPSLSIESKAKKIDGHEPTEIFDPLGIIQPLKVIYAENINAQDEAGNIKVQRLLDAYSMILSEKDGEIQAPPNFNSAFCKLFSTLVKKEVFCYEKEYRFIVVPVIDIDWNQKINFWATDSAIKPYVNLCFTYEDKKTGIFRNIGWPIASITIGPGREQRRTFESVVARLELGEVKAFEITFAKFKDRLEKYLRKILSDVFHDEEKERELTESILGSIFSADIKMQDDIHANSYEKAKELILRMYQEFDTLKGKLTEEKQASFEKILEANYFSWHGIHVFQSTVPYVFA